MEDLLRAIDRLIHEFEPRSVTIEATVTQSPGVNAKGQLPELTIRQTYVATRAGQRYFEEVGRRADGAGFRRAGYCNGRECTSIGYQSQELERQRDVNISHQFLVEGRTGLLCAPDPWIWSHVGLTPVHEALPSAEHLGLGEILGRRTEIYRFSRLVEGIGPRACIYHLDEATSVPLRVEIYAHPERVARNQPDTVWQALGLDVVGDRHVARRSTMTQWSIQTLENGGETIQEVVKRDTTIDSIRFDEALSSSRFVPRIEPGMRIVDSTTKKVKVTPGQRVPMKAVEPGPTATSAEIPRVEPHRDASAWLSGLGLALSVGVLIVAFVLWRRSS